MSSKWFYRIASVLLVLFAVGHTLGFRKTPPEWGVDSIVSAMRTLHFSAQGFDRTYYDFYVGFGLFVSVLLLFTAAVVWQLGGMSRETLAAIPGIRWSLVVCFIVVDGAELALLLHGADHFLRANFIVFDSGSVVQR